MCLVAIRSVWQKPKGRLFLIGAVVFVVVVTVAIGIFVIDNATSSKEWVLQKN